MTRGNAPRARGVDRRVADSPVVSLRFHADSWAADLETTIDDARAELSRLHEQRGAAMVALRDNENLRRHVLQAPLRYAPRDVVRVSHDGFALTSELGRLEARTTAVKQRLDAALAARSVMRAVSEALRGAATQPASVDARAGRLSQASRQMDQLIGAHHDEIASLILDGPMQKLVEAVWEAELAQRTLNADADAAAQHVARCRAATGEAAQELDVALQRLCPFTTERSLSSALRDLLDSAAPARSARLHIIGVERRLAPLVELSLYRIVEEALDNAVRHGRPSLIEVVLSYHQDRVMLLVKDDGEGFDVFATEARLGRTRGLGLISMHERAALAGSRLEVRSLIGEGTEVRLMLAQRERFARGV